MKKNIIRRRADGLFWVVGIDAPNTWTSDPLRATPRGYMYLRDMLDGIGKPEDFEVVEIEITATLTGRTTDDLFRDGMDIDEWGKDQCRVGMHSWIDDPSVTDPEAECTRTGCTEKYGYV